MDQVIDALDDLADGEIEFTFSAEDIVALKMKLNSDGAANAIKIGGMSSIYFEVAKDFGDRRGTRGMY